MVKDVSKLFTVSRDEKGQVATLVIQAGVLGFFYGIFTITSHAIFLARFDVNLLAIAYLITGITGFFLTFLFSRFKVMLKFPFFSYLNFGFILISTLIISLLLKVSPGNRTVFLMFILTGPLYLIGLKGLYDTADRIIQADSKPNFRGLIENIIIAGGLAGSLIVPILLSFSMVLTTIFFLAVLSIVGVFIIQAVYLSRYTGSEIHGPASIESGPIRGFHINDRYSRLVALFVIASAIVLFFVQFTFLAATKEQYRGESEIAMFLGIFEGCVLLLVLPLRSFFASYLIKNHGLRLSVLIGPVLITIFTFIAAISGSAGGYSAAASGFTMFFLFLAISRMFTKSLKDSVEPLNLKVFVLALSKDVRHSLYSAIYGSFNEIAVFISGLLLTVAGAFVFGKFLQITWLTPFLSILWLITGFRLYKEYRDSIKKTMVGEKASDAIVSDNKMQPSISEMGFSLINDYFNFIEGMIAGNNEYSGDLCKIIIRKGELSPDAAIIPLLRKFCEHNDSTISGDAKRVLGLIESGDINQNIAIPADISRAMEMEENKISFVQSLVSSGKRLLLTDLLLLIRNSDDEIKRIAIHQSGKYHVDEILPELCECLSVPTLATDAYSVIRVFGEKAFKPLASAFYRSSGSTEIRILILRLFGESGSEQAIEFLLPRLWSVHKLIRREALTALIKCGYKPDNETKKKLLNSVQELIGLLAWNFSTSLSLKGKSDPALEEDIKNETRWWLDFLFDMLSLIYSNEPVARIRSELDSGTPESIGLALEMLDIILDEEIKPAIKALLESVPVRNRLNILYRYNPAGISSYAEAIEDLINKDYNHISVWTKSSAIRSLHKFEDPGDMGFILALLFSPHLVLREEAGKYLRERFSQAWEIAGYRLPETYRDHLEKVFKNESRDEDEVYYRVMVLSQFIGGMQRDRLVNLAHNLERTDSTDIGAEIDFLLLCKPLNNGDLPSVYGRWRACGLDNIPATGSHLLKDKVLYILKIDHIANAVFIDPGLKRSIYPLIDGITERKG